MTQDLIGSRIDVFIGPAGANTINLASSGKLKVLATLTPERVAAFKNVPSVRESKALKEFVYGVWVSLFVKRDTPESVVQTLHKATSAALSDPALTPAFEAQSIARSPSLTLVEAEQTYRTSTEQFRAIAKSINLQPE